MGSSNKLIRFKALIISGILCLLLLMVLFLYAEKLTSVLESQSYPGKIIYSRSSPYQRIILTRNSNDFRLFLNSNLQFSSQDEYRYHEALVHPAMQASESLENVLILGGGDGIAAREVLKYDQVKSVTLVDLDPAITTLFKTHPALININKKSLSNTKLKIINDDAFIWLLKNKKSYDCIIADFPDPSTFAIAKLYSNTFYKALAKRLKPKGWCVIQCTSPYAAKNSFWIIDTTIRSVGLNTIPYYNTVPSFGIWGYILCSKQNTYDLIRHLPKDLKFYNAEQFALMRNFPLDMKANKTIEINKLNNQILVSTFEEEWSKYLQ